MGQEQSRPGMSVDDMYSNYIQQQQQLLIQQQQQIQDLYQMNLEQQQGYQQQQQGYQQQQQGYQQQQQGYQQQQQGYQQSLPDHSLRKLPSTKLDPYTVLGIPKQFNESMLKKAYLKVAMISHPDRGGSKDEFQKVSIAYTVLKKKLKEQGEIHHHDELKKNADSFMGSQQGQGQNINFDKDNFDSVVFNKIYEENKIEEAFDDGYGSWMQETESISSQSKMFQGNFNKDMFNHEFEKYKQEQKQKMGNQMIQYQEPQERMSMKNQDSLVTLGQGKVSNFSGEIGNLGFSDYKAAFTTDSTLINTSSVDIHGRAHDIKGVEHERSNISYKMSSEDQQSYNYQEALQKKEESMRSHRLKNYDKQHEDNYHKIHQLLIR